MLAGSKTSSFCLANWLSSTPKKGFFWGTTDRDRVAINGVSYGAMSAEMCRRDDRLRCAALLDATNFQLPSAGSPKPFLATNTTGSAFLAESQSFFNKASVNATGLQISGGAQRTARPTADSWCGPSW
ncbi:MAG: hypothetical protein FJ387_20090 [Verrucomicrobia bacterium]|nr:hypothetical protein [Verrucomicrobiota bacterium]